MGSASFIFGIAGMAVCILLLIILPKIFEKQKKRLLREIESEEV